jgi:hypothetical protein
MISLAEVLVFLDSLAKLGASPAVQQLVTAFLAKQMGVAQAVLDAAVLAAKDAPPPTVRNEC